MAGSGEIYDVIVVGAGIVGSGAAYYLAKQKHNTLLLEQFALPHTRGSSHGQSRVIRKAYTEDYYASLMNHAYEFWKELEEESQTQLFVRAGMLHIAKPDNKDLKDTQVALDRSGNPYEMLGHAEFRRRYPQFHFNPSYVALLDAQAGLLKAHKALTTIQTMFVKHGGRLRDETQVNEIIPGDTVTVVTNKGRFHAHRIILTPGPWAAKMLKPLGINIPLKVVRLAVCYWRSKCAPSECRHTVPGGFPTFITTDSQLSDVYGLPAYEYENCIKVCMHTGPEVNPDSRDDNKESWDLETLTQFVHDHFPGVEDKPCIVERCMYTVTPDEDFVLDYHPKWKNIVIGCGMSGHGFKFGATTGQLLAELALGKPTLCDMRPFKMARFGNVATKAQL